MQTVQRRWCTVNSNTQQSLPQELPLPHGPHGVVLLLLPLRRRGHGRRRKGGLDGRDEPVPVVGYQDGQDPLLGGQRSKFSTWYGNLGKCQNIDFAAGTNTCLVADHGALHVRGEVRGVDAEVEGVDARLKRFDGRLAILQGEEQDSMYCGSKREGAYSVTTFRSFISGIFIFKSL